MAKTKCLNKPSMIMDDRQYLDEHFQICSLLVERYDIKRKAIHEVQGFGRPVSVGGKRRQNEARELIDQQRCDQSAERLKNKSQIFWERVKSAEKAGKHFVVEKIARHYRLDLFEKELLLMFIYLNLTCLRSEPLELSEILLLVNMDDSISSVFWKAYYFNDNQAIIKHELIKEHTNHFGSGDKVAYSLNREKLKMISKMLNGEVVKLPKLKQDVTTEIEVNVDVNSLGYDKVPEVSLDEVVLKEETKEKVKFFLDPYKAGNLIKTGVVFLFYGPPGTGKTMLAEATASYLGKGILVMDFSKIMGKYVGETEKQIAKAFRTAKEEDLVLVINEADTLCMNRSMMRHDWGVREVNVMLTELENYKGVAVLTTNMDVLLDAALERRVNLKIKFEVPDETLREEIWQRLIPKEVQLDLDVNFEELAKKYEFSGGYIKNAVQNAYRKALARKSSILTMADMVFGADLEKDGMFTKNEAKTPIGFGN